MKQCSTCKNNKPISEFYVSRRRDGEIMAYCKKCSYASVQKWREENKEKWKQKQQRYHQKNKESIYEKRKLRKNIDSENTITKQKLYNRKSLLKKYGLTIEQYEHILIQQDRKCKICKSDFSKKKKAVIDHDHKSQKIRGLLCVGCNVSLGHIERDGFLEKAIEYLKICDNKTKP